MAFGLVERAAGSRYGRMQAALDAVAVKAAPMREKRQLRMTNPQTMDCQSGPVASAGRAERVPILHRRASVQD